jgi:hypothetical protein
VKPPLELAVEITDASGTTYRWGSEKTAGDIPQAIRFGTRQGDGFADATITLSRRIDQDYVDLSLLNDVVIYLTDGTVVYEGRISALPRSLQDTHTITVTCAGHMAHAKDRRFQQVYVDRDLSNLEAIPLARRAAITAAGFVLDQDYSSKHESGALGFDGVDGKAISNNSVAELFYTAPSGQTIAKLQYLGSQANTTNVEAATFFTSANEDMAAAVSNGLTLDSTLREVTIAAPERYGMLRARATATHTPAAGSPLRRTFNALAFYGAHGLTTRDIDSTTPDGLYASDVIAHIVSNWCPRLNSAGVEATTFPIPHLVFRERTTPYDAFLEINKYHQWQLAVWEDKTLHFEPHDLTDHDWEVRLSDYGVNVDLQGDSVGELANGIEVEYQSVTTGRQEVITPDDSAELSDTSLSNPANLWGLDLWTSVRLSSPTTEDAAIQFAEFNAPKAPGSITLRGHVRDRAGHWHPVSKLRAGETLVLADHPNDAVRLIGETSYDHSTQTMTVSVDNTARRLDAVLDRQANALAAANLG